MYRSYFKIGWRSLLRNKGYAFINIVGLALGMSVAILNGLWIWDELSFDRHFENYNQIAAVAETGKEDGEEWFGTTMTYPLGTELIDKYGQYFSSIARVSMEVNSIVASGNEMVSEDGFYADPQLSEMFSLQMKSGTRAGLAQTHAVMLSASLAQKLFGDKDPLNQVIRINNKSDVSVAGVYEDFPHNTSFYGVNFIDPWSLYQIENPWIEQRALTNWRNHFLRIYVQLPEQSDFASVTAQIKDALQFDPEDVADATKNGTHLELHPMSQWHLHPNGPNNEAESPMTLIKSVGTIGVFVLLLACINFMNFSTARSEKRAKEVGIRKTIGSLRTQLVSQFFTEAFLVVFFSFLIALVVTSFVLPEFNDIAAKEITMPWREPFFWMTSAAFILATSLMAGSYPAFYLSSFNPISALKGGFRAGHLAALPRKVLVIAQFSISVILIISTVVIYQQIQFTKNRPVGYDREGLITIKKKSKDFYGKYEVLRNELKNTGVVVEVSESMGQVTETASGNNGWAWSGREPLWDKSFVTLSVSHTHGKTIGWQFVDGRDFSTELSSDSSGIVINEAAARFMELENPVGEPVSWTWWDSKKVKDYKILGVIKDVVMDSPADVIEPSIFYLQGFNGTPSWINIRLNPAITTSEALAQVEQVFKKVIPTAPFEYNFVDQEYALKFAAEERIGKLVLIFSSLAILISCLGIFGLAAFVAEQRTKEIGIRKVLGASVYNLWTKLSVDFVLLVLIACAISVPVAAYFMGNWLEKYAYRIELSTWTFLLACAGAVALTLVTVSFQTVKGAVMNPVKSLRSE